MRICDPNSSAGFRAGDFVRDAFAAGFGSSLLPHSAGAVVVGDTGGVELTTGAGGVTTGIGRRVAGRVSIGLGRTVFELDEAEEDAGAVTGELAGALLLGVGT
jgi:hypothetical protein